MKKCEWCGKEFKPDRPIVKTCSISCGGYLRGLNRKKKPPEFKPNSFLNLKRSK